MVRKYVRNLRRGPGVVEAALETIKAGTMSVRETSKNFGINEATLRDKLKHVNSQRGWQCLAWCSYGYRNSQRRNLSLPTCSH